jgi:hypothetical protein
MARLTGLLFGLLPPTSIKLLGYLLQVPELLAYLIDQIISHEFISQRGSIV